MCSSAWELQRGCSLARKRIIVSGKPTAEAHELHRRRIDVANSHALASRAERGSTHMHSLDVEAVEAHGHGTNAGINVVLGRACKPQGMLASSPRSVASSGRDVSVPCYFPPSSAGA